MSLVYIDAYKMEEKFRSYDLNFDNILEFMAADDKGDKYRRVLKLYLCSLLESYKHIDYLRFFFYFFYDGDFSDGIEFRDIISSSGEYSFWKRVLEDRSNFDVSSLLLWINVHFDDYFRYIFNDFKESKKDVGEKEQLERVNDKKNHLFKTFNECVPQGVSIDRFNSFVGVVLKYIKQNYESIEEDELVWGIKCFCEDVFWGDYVTLLKNDLVFNYYMILGLFSSDLMNSSSLDEILTIIRKLFYGNAKKFLGCSREELINLKADYRDFQCVGNDDFWNATPSYDEISACMSALFKKYEMLCCDNDDASYALNSFKLSQELLQIHPFRNGNGRTSKYLLFLLSIKRNILPITMTDGHYLPECYYRMERLRDDKVLADYFRYREEVMQRRFK